VAQSYRSGADRGRRNNVLIAISRSRIRFTSKLLAICRRIFEMAKSLATINPAKLPAQYQAARKALTVAVRLEQAKLAKNVLDASDVMAVYAYKAKDGDLAGDSAELKMCATRSIGEIISVRAKAGTLAKAGRKTKKIGVSKTPKTLAEEGVDKNLAKRARFLFAMPAGKFEAEVRKARRLATAAAEGAVEVVKEARRERLADVKAKRATRERAVASKIMALPKKRYGVIYADPEWQFEAGASERSTEEHYTTSPLEIIKSRDVPSICADDCVLFLWGTAPMLLWAIQVLEAWGFDYVTNFCWVKDCWGLGFWNRGRHEHLLIGKRGNIPAPAPGDQWDSVIEAARGRHSEKPALVYDLIEAYFPNIPKIELNARVVRDGWDSWGFEARKGQ
jgi:N6-adenosine-specific RNA methylase IME4